MEDGSVRDTIARREDGIVIHDLFIYLSSLIINVIDYLLSVVW